MVKLEKSFRSRNLHEYWHPTVVVIKHLISYAYYNAEKVCIFLQWPAEVNDSH